MVRVVESGGGNERSAASERKKLCRRALAIHSSCKHPRILVPKTLLEKYRGAGRKRKWGEPFFIPVEEPVLAAQRGVKSPNEIRQNILTDEDDRPVFQ